MFSPDHPPAAASAPLRPPLVGCSVPLTALLAAVSSCLRPAPSSWGEFSRIPTTSPTTDPPALSKPRHLVDSFSVASSIHALDAAPMASTDLGTTHSPSFQPPAWDRRAAPVVRGGAEVRPGGTRVLAALKSLLATPHRQVSGWWSEYNSLAYIPGGGDASPSPAQGLEDQDDPVNAQPTAWPAVLPGEGADENDLGGAKRSPFWYDHSALSPGDVPFPPVSVAGSAPRPAPVM
ncbi:hypothetical protein AMAG_11285 [Allomyces macrogynus ATCC 38327]|uniref:Uncharacterized protein n=1 Tax=Allomyces macrogynus (strain ATCC 38327) TaxID=578462 RepID=A0A0L0SWR2_ALLM3|nr:hypothetical protein AMAG_11285 [Allomyces macrogynus ATCC 38327]|eukprot:KNE66794.1 hypothetical protein AMAG_11285 [Allomyces macrogynus ATCC 38327]